MGAGPRTRCQTRPWVLTGVVAIMWALIGVVFFVAPSLVAGALPVARQRLRDDDHRWLVPGAAFLAGWAALMWTWGAVLPSLAYLWAFGALRCRRGLFLTCCGPTRS